jgi:hypothetical protein
MDNFEKKLQNLKVPFAEDKKFENALWDSLIAKFLKEEGVFKLRFKIAAVFALLFMVLFTLVLIKPDLATKINNLAFGNKKEAELEKVLFTLPDDQTNYNSIVYKSENGHNPYSNFPEEKRYIIHKYRMGTNKKVMVVSEVPINKKSKVKVIY